MAHGSTRFAKVSLLFQVILIGLFAGFVDYDSHLAGSNAALETQNDVTRYYGVYQDVHVMIFVGFGFLMTFLAKYGFGAVGLNFFLSAMSIQWCMFLVGIFDHVHTGHEGKINLSIKMLIEGDFGAGAVMITFGALLGKTSPLQMLVVMFSEIIWYNLNFFIGAYKMQAVDMGGSIFVHSFGAYFGLGCAWVLGRGLGADLKEHKRNKSSKTSDTFAMIGTIFLWMFWPSFNGALAGPTSQHRVVVNTVLALCGSCCGAFIFSQLFRRGKLSMVDVQNATLAGGVAVGSAADLVIQPWAAILVGLCASLVSVAGYFWLQPAMERTCGLFDTCGVHNLHGMPGVIGGISGTISAATVGASVYGHNIATVYPAMAPVSDGGLGRTAGEQAVAQISALLITLAISITTGMLTGCLAKCEIFEPPQPRDFFSDHTEWDEVSDSDNEGSDPAQSLIGGGNVKVVAPAPDDMNDLEGGV